MPSSLRVVCMVVLLATFAFSQTGTPGRVQTGYAIITPESGNSAGLIPTETLTHATANGIVETTLSPSPVLTNMAMTVNLGTLAEGTTGIAIVNPTAVAANVQFAITDPSGNQLLAQTFTVLPHGQLSRFVNELFAGQITAGMQSMGLLNVAADVPVAAVGLNFRDAGFTEQPLASLTSPMPLTSFTTSTDPQTPTVAQPIVGVLASTTPTIGVPATTSTPSVGGAAAFILPQVVNGGGWSTSISIANTSTASQVVRIDFFDAVGIAVKTVSGIIIPSRGLYNLVQ